MVNKRAVVFTFDERNLVSADDIQDRYPAVTLVKITLTNPRTGESRHVLIPKVDPHEPTLHH